MKHINKVKLLDDPRINHLYQQFLKKNMKVGMGMGKQGCGAWEDFLGYLKKSKIISNIGSVLLPAAGAAAGLLLSPLGGLTGAAVGKSGAELIKSAGYGKHGLHMKKGMGYKFAPSKLGSGANLTTPYGTISSEFGRVRF